MNEQSNVSDISYVDATARALYNIFADGMVYNPQGISSIGNHTYEKLADLFGQVDPLQRASVFIKFKKELDDAGINYDVASFYSSDQAVS